MKRSVAVFVFLLFAVGLPGFAQAPAPTKALSPLEQTLVTAEKSFIAAARKHDADYFKRTLADDYMFAGYDGQLHDRVEILDERSSDILDLMPYNMKVLLISDGAAVITYDVILQIPPAEDQGPPPRYQHWSSVWTKEVDQWKLKFQQSTPTHWGDW